MPLIEPGQKAPAFTLNDQHSKAHRLSDYAGRPVVLAVHSAAGFAGNSRLTR